MYGSDYFKIVRGDTFDVSYLGTGDLNLGTAGLLRRGTHIDSQSHEQLAGQLGSGHALGWITQDIDANGYNSLQGFKDHALGIKDRPVKKGNEITVRQVRLGGELEFEGLGEAVAGNLVCTTGTGAIATNTARWTRLSVQNGCIRIAQTGESVIYELDDANVTPIADAANVRIRVRKVGDYRMA